jgi:hypothetical protein
MTVNTKIRNIPWILMTVFMISAMVYSATAVRSASAQAPAIQLFVDPSQTTLTNAVANVTTFQVNVTIANVTGVAGLQFRLEWNASLFKIASLNEIFFHTVTPAGSFSNIWAIKLSYNNTGGYAEYAQAWQDSATAQIDGYAPANVTTANYPPEGKLAVASFTFQVLQVPPNAATYYDSNLNIPPESVTVGDLAANPMDVVITNGHYRIYGPPETITTLVPYLGTNYAVTTETNASLVTDSVNFVKINDTSYELVFNLTGTDGTTAYVNVTIPKALMSIGPSENWTVAVNGQETTPIVTSNETDWYLYLTTTLSTKEVEIWGTVPEFTLLFIPLLIAATLVAVGLRRRKLA